MDSTEFNDIEKVEKHDLFYRQLFLCLMYVSFYFALGLCFGSPTVVVPQLQRQANSTAAVSDEMASWITSIVPYSGVVWMIIFIIASHHFGRKKVLGLLSLNCSAAFLVIYHSKNIQHVFISQFMQGMTQGGILTVLVMCKSEYTTAKSRGIFFSLSSATFHLGIWAANALGYFFHYSIIGIVGIVFSVYSLISSFFVPESPYWLAVQGKYQECAIAHRWLKGNDIETEKELNALIKYQEEVVKAIHIKRSLINNIKYYVNVLKEPEIYKPLFLCLLVSCLYNFSGKLTCAVYAVEIMKKITKSLSKAYSGVLILDGFSVLSIYVGTVLIKYLKRRTLLNGTCVGCIITLLLLSCYLYLVKCNILLENYYISLLLLICYSFASCAGPIVAVPLVFGELLPLNHRSLSVCIATVMGNILFATFLKLGPSLFKTFEMYGTFLFFGLTLSVWSYLSYKYLPETKDKTLQEISDIFTTKNPQVVAELPLLENGRREVLINK